MPIHTDTPRERIIKGAQALFFKKGIRNVTMNDIAQSLHISKRTIYELFTDKDELLIHCFREQETRYRQHIEKYATKETNVLHVVLESMTYYFSETAYINPQFFKDLPKSPKVLEFFEDHRRKKEDEVVIYLERGKAQGLLRPEIDLHIFYLAIQRLDVPAFYGEYMETHNIKTLFRHTILAYLRGCATTEGVKIIDAFEQDAYQIRT